MATTIESLLTSLNKQQKEEKEAGSWAWFVRRAKELRKDAKNIQPPTTATIIKNQPNKLSQFPTTVTGQGTLIGRMILFRYDPKTKATLPYYDRYPIGYPIEIYPDGYLMLNLHYLPPALRAKLMDNLYSFMANPSDGITDKSRLLLSYRLLKQLGRSGLYQPCVKRYLFSHVKSQWATIKPTEWDLAAMLPLQKFFKGSETQVWMDSVKIAHKGGY